MKKIVITGALGMLGKALVKELVKKNYSGKLVLTDIVPHESFSAFVQEIGTVSTKIEYAKANILDAQSFKKMLSECDTVFHLAGIISYNRKDEEKINEVNVEGTRLITRLSEEMQVKRIVYASSISAVSLLLDQESTEGDYPPADASYLTLYSKSKIKGEEVFFSVKNSGVVKIAANLGVIIGKSKQFEGVINGIQKSPILPILSTYNSYIDVRDAAKGLLFLSQYGANNERYIVTGYNVTNGDFVNEIAKQLTIKKLRVPIPRSLLAFFHSCISVFLNSFIRTDVWKSMAENKRFSTEKINKLGWTPEYSLQESIRYLIST